MIFRKDTLTKIFFATDIHGSEKCWKKLVNTGSFYEVDTIILGGDITGKGIQALLEVKPGVWQTNFLGEEVEADSQSALENLESRIRTAGFYPYRIKASDLEEFSKSDELRQEVFRELVIESIQHWVELAEAKLKNTGRKIIVTAGNDDPLFIDDLFKGSSVIVMAERQVLFLDDYHEMINEGYSNPTPWKTHRELDEETLYKEMEKQVSQIKDMKNAVFNLHVPPYNSKLDEAPVLDENLVPIDGGRTYGPAGSTAVRDLIEKYQPLLSLHGHIHESRGSVKIGRTLCLNPGSSYIEGALSGYLIILDKKGIRGYQPVQG
jgi:Icc-related predicted phosphoesterase